jgi:quercetin dioxygenase-like cupin family protein
MTRRNPMTRRNILCAAFGVCAATLVLGIYSMNAQAPAHPWQAPAHGAAPAHQANLLLTSDLDGVYNKELRVLRTIYPPGAANTKHYHTSHVVFYILEGEGVWQEEGRAPVTLRAGDTLLVKPGTIHAHWNPSATVPLVFSEVVIVDKGQRSTVRMP